MSLKFSILTISLLLLVLVSNIVFLDIVVFSRPSKPEPLSVIAPSVPEPDTATQCPSDCSNIISREIAAQIATISAVLPSTPTLSPPDTPRVKEFHIPIGSGSSKSSSYEALLGAETYINTDNFPPIKQATLEVFMHIPTGNGRVYVKLFNATDGHDVWFSELWSEGDKITRKEASITLDRGQKRYQIMAKSTMSYEVVVDSARIKLITQ